MTSDIISREQEFLKLNERLNQLNLQRGASESKMDEGNTDDYSCSTIRSTSKFSTFTKTKGGTFSKKPIARGTGSLDDSSRIDTSTITLHHHHQAVGGRESSIDSGRKTVSKATTNTDTFTVRHNGTSNSDSLRSSGSLQEESQLQKKLKSSAYASNAEAVTVRRKQVAADNVVKFLKGKVDLLEKDNNRLNNELSRQKELLECTMERQKKSEQMRDQAYSKRDSLVDYVKRIDNELGTANAKIKDFGVEISSKQKELDAAQREIRSLKQQNTTLEKRLAHANEDLESVRGELAKLKAAEQELRESSRSEIASKEKSISALKKHRADLLLALRKQLYLAENLKQQNICLEQAKMIEFGEKDFAKVLEWKATESSTRAEARLHKK